MRLIAIILRLYQWGDCWAAFGGECCALPAPPPAAALVAAALVAAALVAAAAAGVNLGRLTPLGAFFKRLISQFLRPFLAAAAAVVALPHKKTPRMAGLLYRGGGWVL